MFMKICPRCQCKSYSANDRGKWYCPICQKDMTDVPVDTIHGALKTKDGEVE